MTRTYHHSEFLPLDRLVDEKTQSGTTVSVVIPTLNEAGRIGSVVDALRREVADGVGLVDEIAVMDGGSADGTAQEAREAGATVHQVAEILPEYPSPQGKGAALWRSQFVVQGQVIVCVDADIIGFDSRFVRGLVGPFLTEPEVCFTKAFYRRSFTVGNVSLDHYGGRVTEILVRPLLSAFCPDLARIRQPLSGEYAFRRRFMEAIPFSSGYGVEIGMLLEIYRRFGTSCVAEVDMGERRHRNRTVEELGKMAFGILQTLMARFSEYDWLASRNPVGREMISLTEEGWEETRIEEILLPAAQEVRRRLGGKNAEEIA